ncbi:MAG: PAS domain S-box protein [Thermodesulfobacteriota bacterium]
MKNKPSATWVLPGIGFLMLLALAGGTWFYRSQGLAMRGAALEELQAIGRLKTDQIVNWRDEMKEDAALLMANASFSRDLADCLEHPRMEAMEVVLQYLHFLREHEQYADVLVVEPEGRIRFGLDQTSGRLHEEAFRALKAALRTRRPVLSDLHHRPLDGIIHMDVVVPFYRQTGGSPVPLGAVVLQVDPGRALFPLIRSWPIPSSSAETLLVRRDGEQVLFLNDLRFRERTALALRLPLSRTDVPAVMAVLGRTGVVEGRDYRGIEVLSVLGRVPDSPWYMVAKMDVREVFAAWHSLSVLIAALIGTLMAGMAAAVIALIQRDRKIHFRELSMARLELSVSETRHRMTLLSVGDGVLATDADGNITMLNPAAENLTGWGMAEAAGRPVDEVFRIINEETRLAVESPVARVLREGQVVGLANHTLLIARDGTEIPIADSGAPIRMEEGDVAGVVLVFRDQSAEREAREALRSSEQRYRDLFFSMLEGFAVHDIICDEAGKPVDYRFLEVNPAFERMTGLAAGTIVGRTVTEVMPNTEAHWIDTYGQVALTGRPIQFENYAADLDRHYRVSAFCPQPGRFAVSFEDITAAKQAAAEKEKLQAQLLQSQKMEAIGRLAGGVAHDFNNMLSIILGYGDMLLETMGPEHAFRESLKEMVDAGNRAKALTRQLLAFGRKQMLEMRTVDLNRIIRNFEKLLARTIGEDIRIHLELSSAEIPVRADAAQLEQVIMNLAVNARDAMPDGGCLTIETAEVILDETCSRQKPGVTPGIYALLAVSDDGLGMDAATQANIFEPFFTTKAVGEGSGLGLSMVYGIVKQHGGNIWVYSEPGQGTTFKVYLPKVAETPVVEEKPAASPAAPEGRATILVVEDDPTVRRLVATMLKKGGFHVLEAGGGPMAVELAENHRGPIHLVLSDVVMPEMKGKELVQRITALHPETRALYMSGYTENVILRQGVLDSGVNFIQKPFSAGALGEKIKKIITN